MAADWPQFLGPDRSGVSSETGLAKTWPADGPPVLWTVPLGEGFGPPAVQGGKVYLLDRANDEDVVRCLDLATGTSEWTFSYAAPGKVDYPGSRSTPAVDDKYVFTIGSFGDVYCLSKATHKPVWQKNLLAGRDDKKPRWALAQSPLLYKTWVIIAPMSDQAGVTALDRATGREVWKSAPIASLEYTSPIVATIDGVEQIIMMGNKGKATVVAGLDAATGKLLWSYDGWNCGIPIPTPTTLGDGTFFVTGGYGGGSATFQVKRDGDQWTVAELWKGKSCGSQIHNALLHEGHLYANSNNTKGGLVCLTPDGAVQWTTRSEPGFDLGGLALADGLIYILDGGNGTLRMVAADPTEYRELGKVKLLDGDKVWAPPVLADGKLLIRDQKQMKCLDVTAK
jgi:outer membrane protein assembly factor BamB